MTSHPAEKYSLLRLETNKFATLFLFQRATSAQASELCGVLWSYLLGFACGMFPQSCFHPVKSAKVLIALAGV